MSQDAEHYGAHHSHGNGTTVWQVGVEHDNTENNAGQTTRPEPAHKKLVLCTHPRTAEHQKHRQYADKGEAKHRV